MEENNGQQPQAGTTNAPQVGTPPNDATPQVGDTPTLTLEQALDALKKARAEAAANRVKLNEYERAQQEAERAKLTKEEQLVAKVADLERAQTERTRSHQEQIVQYEVRLAAAKQGIVDPDAAAKLLDWSQIDYDDAGNPKNVGKLLQDLIKNKPYLASPQSGSPANPPRQNTSLTFTQSQIAQMSPEEYQRNRAAIARAMKEGRILQG